MGPRVAVTNGRKREGLKSALRATLLQYARDVAAAQDRSEEIDLMENMEQYVDRVVERS